METQKNNPITLTAEQVGDLKRYYDNQFDNMNRLALLAQLFDTEVVELDEAACIGIVSILNEISSRVVLGDQGNCPLDFLHKKQAAKATA